MLTNPLLFSLIIAIIFNLIAFLIAFKYQTDKLTDITYATTFMVITFSLFFIDKENISPYQLLIGAMPILWAIRLGGYLLTRVMDTGKDHRFDSFRAIWWKFGSFFALQAISIWVIALPYMIALSSTISQENMAFNSVWLPIGGIIFLFGFIVETVADVQKYNFRKNPKNDGQFMDKGLFSIVRFPNYTGEILVWIGIFIACIPVLESGEWASIFSPIWIAILLIKISGIPYLEASNRERYGHLAAFQKYKKETKQLIPGVF